MSKLGFHTSHGDKRGLAEFLMQCYQAGNPVPVIFALDQNMDYDVKTHSPSTLIVFRTQKDSAGHSIGDGPGTMYQGGESGALAAANDWMAMIMPVWALNRANWYAPLNEQDPPTRAAFTWLNTFNLRCLEIAEANGYKLALCAFSAGNPKDYPHDPTDFTIYEAWQELLPSLQRGKASGHILLLHEYGLSFGMLKQSRPHLAERYRRSYRFLEMYNADLPLVISEASAGVGYATDIGDDNWINDAKWYDGELMRDRAVIGCCLYQIGGAENWYKLMPDVGAYISITPTPAPESGANAVVPGPDVDDDGNPMPGTIPPSPISDSSQAGEFAGRGLSIVDAQGASWTLGGTRQAAGYPILKNGQQHAGGLGMELLSHGGLLYTSNDYATWFRATATGWSKVPGDPRLIQPPPTSPGPFWVMWPVKPEGGESPRITDPFNAPRPGYGSGTNHLHEGVDSDAYINSLGKNATIVAAQTGIVDYVSRRTDVPSYGLHVVIRHPWGSDLSRYRTLYAHLTSVSVQVGQQVTIGQPIGVAGGSGVEGGVIHLHFNVHDATQGLKGYVRCVDCSGLWADGVLDPAPLIRYETTPPPATSTHPPAVTHVLYGIGAGGQNEITQQQADVYGRGFSADAHSSFKFLTLPDGGMMSRSITKIKAKNPGALLMARLFMGKGNTPVTPQQFVDTCHNGTAAAYANGIRHFEVHNEPNLDDEGLGVSWPNGVGFGNWLKSVLDILIPRYPDARWWFPGLSPNNATPQFMVDALSTGVGARLHGICYHAYWWDETSGNYRMVDESGGLSWLKQWRVMPASEKTKPLAVTEFSNNSPDVLPGVKGQQYQRYREILRQNGIAVATAFALNWSGDPNRENFVNDQGGTTGIIEGYLGLPRLLIRRAS